MSFAFGKHSSTPDLYAVDISALTYSILFTSPPLDSIQFLTSRTDTISGRSLHRLLYGFDLQPWSYNVVRVCSGSHRYTMSLRRKGPGVPSFLYSFLLDIIDYSGSCPACICCVLHGIYTKFFQNIEFQQFGVSVFFNYKRTPDFSVNAAFLQIICGTEMRTNVRMPTIGEDLYVVATYLLTFMTSHTYHTRDEDHVCRRCEWSRSHDLNYSIRKCRYSRQVWQDHCHQKASRLQEIPHSLKFPSIRVQPYQRYECLFRMSRDSIIIDANHQKS